MRKMCVEKFSAWFLRSWKGFFAVGAILLTDEFLRQGYFFKMSDVFALRPTHEKFLMGAFLLRLAGPLLAKKK